MENNLAGNDNILEIKNLTKSFKDTVVLKDFNLSVSRGEFVCLIGPSGCGKTTLLKILAGLITGYSGQIISKHNDTEKLPCSMAFQNSPLFPWLTILDNLVICMNRGFSSEKEKRDLALLYLEKVDLAEFKDFFPYEISGGMEQRVNIVRSLITGSEVVFMDEPFVHLDFLLRNSLQKMTSKMLENEKRTILFVTHNIHEAVTLSDRVVVMSAQPGKIIKEFGTSLARPRDIDAIREDERYIRLIKEINALLLEENDKSLRQLKQCIKESH